MATTKETLSGWFDAGVKDKYDYMIVVCDSYDMTDYPVYCFVGEFKETYDHVKFSSMQRIMEIYSLSLDKQMQMDEHRAFHYPIGWG